MRQQVCDFELQWWPGSKVQYHSAAAHLTCAVLIEAVTGRDYREFIRSEVLDPLGIDDIQVGVPEQLHGALRGHAPREDGAMIALPSETDSTDLSELVEHSGRGGWPAPRALAVTARRRPLPPFIR